MNTVFEVTLSKPANAASPAVFHSRRAHTKSRAGCTACKQKRVKCDEGKPVCKRCSRQGSDCIYMNSESTEVAHGVQLSKCLSGTYAAALHHSVDNLEGRLDEIVINSMQYRSSELRIKCLRDIQHFSLMTSKELGGPRNVRIILSTLHQTIWKHPYLMHLVLAVSNAHLKRLYRTDGVDANLIKQSEIGEAAHWQLALRLYREEIAHLQSNIQGYTGDLDAVMVGTSLCTVFLFSLEDEVPRDAFTTNNMAAIDSTISAFMSTTGFRVIVPLLQQLVPNRGKDVNNAKTLPFFIPSPLMSIEDLPLAFVELFELSDDTYQEDTFYHNLISQFVPPLIMKHNLDNLARLFAFLGEIWPTWRPHIMTQDPRSLLILAWWLAMVRKIGLWWLVTRAETLCLAIVEYLTTLNDPTLEPFLTFPASLGDEDYDWVWDGLPVNEQLLRRYRYMTVSPG